jgi:putative ABC transport system permease protein
VNLALRDVRYRFGRFVMTAVGLGLLLATVVSMGGILRGLVDDSLSVVRAAGADLWVVQKDTNGPFAESSRLPEDVYRVIRAVPGVRDASPVAFQSLQLRVGPRPFRVQLVGHRPFALGAAPAVVDGVPLTRRRYDMVIDRKAGVATGAEVRIGRTTFTVVGLTEGIVSNAGDPVAFVSLEDAQDVQFLKANETVRNERSRRDADVAAAPALAGVSATALAPLLEDTHLANAVLVRLAPGADAGAVAAHIERWVHYRAMTQAEQEDVLARSVIDRARQQLFLFRAILLAVSAVVIALVVYTRTVEKTRDIATLKVIGAPDRTIAALVLQEALALGVAGFGLGVAIIHAVADYFPRRVVLVAVDQWAVFAIVVVICAAASVVGIRRALGVDPTTALAGGWAPRCRCSRGRGCSSGSVAARRR